MKPFKIYIIAPHQDEDFTQYIAAKIAQLTGAVYLPYPKKPRDAALIIEIGGVWDRDENEMYIQDKTRTKVFNTVLPFYFRAANIGRNSSCNFETALSKTCDSNYCRIELTNRVRYSEVMREFFIFVVSEIVEEAMKLLNGGVCNGKNNRWKKQASSADCITRTNSKSNDQTAKNNQG